MFKQHGNENADVVALAGASLVSAVGSLMQHLAPFLALAMIAGGWTSIAGAGWVRSLSQMGELAIALALPLLGIARFGRKSVGIIAALFAVGIALAAVSDQSLFLLGWFVIGACSGTLKYLGTTAAARASKVSFAFAMRLAFVLVLAGAASAGLAAGTGLLTYQSTMLVLAIIVVAILLIGALMLRPGKVAAATREAAAKPVTRSNLAAASSLAVIYLFFVGISGVMVFVLHQAAEHHITVATAGWAIATTKFTVGIWLVAAASYAVLKGKADRFMLQAVILVGALGGMAMARDGFTLLCALLFFETSVNSLSVRLQAAVVRGAPAYVSRYLNFVMMTGIATGPLLNGLLVSAGHAHVYVLLGAAAAFAPAVWSRLAGQSEVAIPRDARRSGELAAALAWARGIVRPATPVVADRPLPSVIRASV